MRFFSKIITIAALALSIFIAPPAKSAGILNQCVNTFCFSTYPQNNPVLVYRVDRGGLGDFSNAEVLDAVERMLEQWNDVSSSTFRFVADSTVLMDEDITADNFLESFDEDFFSREPFGFTPIVLDEDGSIIDALGLNSDSILGFAGASAFFANGDIGESLAFFNGKLFTTAITGDSAEFNQGQLDGVILHELFHAIGGDHTATHQDVIPLLLDETVSESVLPNIPSNFLDTIPIMFPFAVNSQSVLEPDDISSISLAYPAASFENDFGTISGRVLRSNNNAQLGVAVTAHDINDPFNNAISSASGIFDFSGNFLIKGLDPGTYALRVQTLDPRFTGGSSVGPHEPALNNVDEGFFNGVNEDLVAQISEVTEGLVTVAAGETVENVIIGGDGNVDVNDDSTTNDDDAGTLGFDFGAASVTQKVTRNANVFIFEMPKEFGEKLRINVDLNETQLANLIKIPKKNIKASPKKPTIKFKVKVKNQIEPLIAIQGQVVFSITITNRDNGLSQVVEFTLSAG